jgi:hypothetical protein
MKWLLVPVCLAMATVPAEAYFCSEPSAPYCANSYSDFDDQDEYDDCRRDMESYASDVDAYIDCLNRASKTALDEYNSAIDSFNRRVN